MDDNAPLCGRAGLAQILSVSESTTRYLEKAGHIRPVQVLGNRPLYRVADAKALKAKRALARGSASAAAPSSAAA